MALLLIYLLVVTAPGGKTVAIEWYHDGWQCLEARRTVEEVVPGATNPRCIVYRSTGVDYDPGDGT